MRAENNVVDSDPKLGALGWLDPWLWPNAGGWLAPNAGPAAGAGGPEPNRNEEDDPVELDVVVAPKVKPEFAALVLLAPEPKRNEARAELMLEDVVAGLFS